MQSSSAPDRLGKFGIRHASELGVKLIWLTAFRTVTTTLLLSAFALRLLSQPATDELVRQNIVPFVLIGAIYLLTVVFGLLLRRGKLAGRAGTSAAYSQVLGDILLASTLVYITGGAESPFTFTYSIAVIASAILLEPPGPLFAAVATSASFCALALLIRLDVLVRPALDAVDTPTDRLVFLLASNALAQFLIAALAGYVSRQLRTTGGKLSVREADLQKLAGLQRQILAAMPSGLITCMANGTITFINRAASAILGTGSNGVKPGNIEELIPGALKLVPGARRSEVAVSTKEGRRILGLNVTGLEGKEDSLLIVFQDLTELRRMEDQLRRIDHLAALGGVAAQLAHEIHNPLASMRGSAQLLAAEASEHEQSRRLAKILIRESDRLTSLLEGFLRFARPPPPVFRDYSLTQLIAETVDLLRADPLTFGVDIELSLSEVSANFDPDQIRQVLLNLIRNACTAAGAGGKVRVSLAQTAAGPVIRVWDSAGSIPESHLACIFDPFFTTREGGSGLGLSIAHSIVQAHGGMIQVSSSPESGTQFVVALPISSGAAVANPGGR